jgi:hypothetical protein
MSQPSIPFILRNSSNFDTARPWHDEHASTDPLPAPIETNASGITIIRTTRITEVRPETTDDR